MNINIPTNPCLGRSNPGEEALIPSSLASGTQGGTNSFPATIRNSMPPQAQTAGKQPIPVNHQPSPSEVDETLKRLLRMTRSEFEQEGDDKKKGASETGVVQLHVENQGSSKTSAAMIHNAALPQEQAVNSQPISGSSPAENIKSFCKEIYNIERRRQVPGLGQDEAKVPENMIIYEFTEAAAKASHQLYIDTKVKYGINFDPENGIGDQINEETIKELQNALNPLSKRVSIHCNGKKEAERKHANPHLKPFKEEIAEDVVLLNKLVSQYRERERQKKDKGLGRPVTLSGYPKMPREPVFSSSSPSSFQPLNHRLPPSPYRSEVDKVLDELSIIKGPEFTDPAAVPSRPAKKARTSDPFEELAEVAQIMAENDPQAFAAAQTMASLRHSE
jgi:hypothetical protein